MFSLFKLEEETTHIDMKSAAKDQMVFQVSADILAKKLEIGCTTAELLKAVIDKLSKVESNIKSDVVSSLSEEKYALKNTNHTL